MTRNVQILSTGSYVPERVVTNAEVDALMGISTGDWLIANLGIRERRWFGFGGSKSLDGQPCYDDFAGSGGGVVNPEFPKLMAAGDRSTENPQASPRVVMNSFYWKPPVEKLVASRNKPHMLWIRGDSDMIVSDNSFFDFGTLGKLGYVPGWPGEEVYPPQPMVGQTRYVLEQYKANGGSYEEVVIPETGHSPYIEKLEEFMAVFTKVLK